MEKMIDWVTENVPLQPAPSILEVGSGNGALLFALQEAGYSAQQMCGVDYSEDAVKLARAIGKSRAGGAENVTFDICDFLHDRPGPLSGAPKLEDGEHTEYHGHQDRGRGVIDHTVGTQHEEDTDTRLGSGRRLDGQSQRWTRQPPADLDPPVPVAPRRRHVSRRRTVSRAGAPVP